MSKNYPLAIPTEYKGIEFHSKLEARWGVFLDQLDIEWSYEPNGPASAPDFGLYGDVKYYYMEVKGGMPSKNCIRHMRSIKCQVIAVGGFFKFQRPTLLRVTKIGVAPILLESMFFGKSKLDIKAAFTYAAQHRFDLARG